MREGTPEDARFYKGTTLSERAFALKRANGPGEFDEALAERRMARWRSRAPLDRKDVFETRLAQDGTNEEELRRLLGESPEALAARFDALPTWARSIFEKHRSDGAARALNVPRQVAFVLAAEPLLASGLARLERAAARFSDEHPACPFDPEKAAALCFPHLIDRASVMMMRTMALELNVARLEGRLSGETPDERFSSFVEHVRKPRNALSLWAEYPVLARQIVGWVDTWVEASTELLGRIAADYPILASTFGGGAELGSLSACKMGKGDPHRGGRTVTILEFSSGVKVVYKPRSLAVDAHFQELLEWLNGAGMTPRFEPLRVVDRGTHGWVEHVPRRACCDVGEVRRFYERLGGYLGVMYALAATDLHAENIIAMGEHPMIIDLESLFHPWLGAREEDSSNDLAARAKAASVLRVGLLPRRGWASEHSDGLDYSGLGGAKGQLTPRAAQTWEGVGTDQMRLVRRRVEVRENQNRPTLNGEDVNPLHYREPLIEGFERIYRLLLSRRDELSSKSGPLARFSQDEIRVIVRPTHIYNLLHRESYHPDVLRDALDRDRFFDKLWIMLDRHPHTMPLVPAERRDLWRDDIPVFLGRAGERHLFSSAGDRYEDFLTGSGMSLVETKLAGLDENDLRQQIWFIRASFAAMSASGAAMPRYTLEEKSTPVDPGRALEAARRIGERLSALALRGKKGDASWIGLSAVGERYWEPMPCGLDLYGGLSGIVLFLAYLGEVTGEDRFSALGRAALATAREKLEKAPASLRSIGATGDIGGMIYMLSHAGALWNEPSLLDEAERLVEMLSTRIQGDEQLDILQGAAGAAISLLCLHRQRPESRALEVARRCGERLLETAKRMERGLGWVTPLGPKPLTGFSHGAAGIAWALFSLAEHTADARFRDAAMGAIEYERSQYDEAARNWRDLREVAASGGFMVAYCHGAPGIALGRALSLPHLDGEKARAEIRFALQTTLDRGFGQNHCLCHGDLGNLECLLVAARALGDRSVEERLHGMAAGILENIEANGILTGVFSGVETPGLFSGIAGTGHALLRLAAEERVPSVLAFEPARGAR